MTEKYGQHLNDAHILKRQIAMLRTNCSNLQSQLTNIEQQNYTLMKTISSIKQNNEELINTNNRLKIQKQQLINKLNRSITELKSQIDKKQQEIIKMQIGEQGFTGKLGENLMIKMIQQQIEKDYQERINNKTQKIAELTNKIQKLEKQFQLYRQKTRQQVKQLEKDNEKMKIQHLEQIQEYVNRIYKESINKDHSQAETLLKKSRRQLDELKKLLDLKKDQLEMVYQQKQTIQKQYNSYVKKKSTQFQKLINEQRIHRLQAQRLTDILNQNSFQKQNSIIRQKQKQNRKLRTEIQELNEQLLKKQKKIQNHVVQIAELKGTIKRQKKEDQAEYEHKIMKYKQEMDSLHKEILIVKNTNQAINEQNRDLVKTIQNYTINQSSKLIRHTSEKQLYRRDKTNNFVNFTNKTNNRPDISINLQQIQENQQIKKKLQSVNDQPIRPTSDLTLNQQQYYRKLEQQKNKVTNIAKRYVDLKKKYDSLKLKLKQANSKIIELLKTKIALKSPKANQYTKEMINTQMRNAYSRQITDPQQIRHNNLSNEFYQKPEAPIFHRSPNIRTSQTNLQMHLARNNMLSPQNQHGTYPVHTFRSPVNNQEKINRTISSGSKQFYERSLNIRSRHKYKQLKCPNHEHQQNSNEEE